MEGSTGSSKLAAESESGLTTRHALSNPTSAPPNPVDMGSGYTHSQTASVHTLCPPPYSSLPADTTAQSQRGLDAPSTASQHADPATGVQRDEASGHTVPNPSIPAASPSQSNAPINSGHARTSTMTNAGMLGGMAVGMGAGGGNLGADMATGMWVGSVVGQRMVQNEKREEIQIAAANGTLDPNSRAGRRYERRSKRRRDRSKKVKKIFGGGSSSSSEGEHD